MIEIIITKDGSHTLRNSELNETYHSIHGAVKESSHVFIKHGLEFVLAQLPQEISILEVGFGTGLNAWLTAKRVSNTPVQLKYVALETHPLNESVWSQLNYAATHQESTLFYNLHRADWQKSVAVTSNFSINKMDKPVQKVVLPPSAFDIIYFDAFAPEKQPEMWKGTVLEKVAGWLKAGGVLVTYCAKGQVKRDLKSAGLIVETLQGPPGKREMVRARKALNGCS